jgi:hypothetical protein
MSGEQERLNAYLKTIERMEPDVAAIDASFAYASVAISLKRIADTLEAANRELVPDEVKKLFAIIKVSPGMTAETVYSQLLHSGFSVHVKR